MPPRVIPDEGQEVGLAILAEIGQIEGVNEGFREMGDEAGSR